MFNAHEKQTTDLEHFTTHGKQTNLSQDFAAITVSSHNKATSFIWNGQGKPNWSMWIFPLNTIIILAVFYFTGQ